MKVDVYEIRVWGNSWYSKGSTLLFQMNFPFEWQPAVVSTQLARFGQLSIACVPGEFTTMAGRRLRRALAAGLGIRPDGVIVAGLCNTYSDYITTPEEYQVGVGNKAGMNRWDILVLSYELTISIIMDELVFGCVT